LIPKDPREYAAPKPVKGKGKGTYGKGTAPGGTAVASTGGGGMPSSYAGVNDYIDPLSVPTGDLDLADMSTFVTQLAKIGKQVAGVGPIDFSGANQRARTAAGQDIAAQVNPLLTQQQQILKTGRQQAGLINQAGLSAAAFTEPWAQAIRDSYMALGNQQLQYAQGLSGATREAALADANAFGNQMAAMGSPQTIDATRANALSSALAGLGGLGAQTLGQQAVAAQIGAYGIPQQMLGYGQAQAAGTLGAATQKAAEINPQIANIRATRSKLTREYASDFRQEAIAIRDSKMNGLKLQADLINSMGTMASASNADKLKIAEFKQNRITAHNTVVEAIRTQRREDAKLAEQVRANKISEEDADLDRAQRAAETAAQITAAQQTLQLQWAQAKGWYRDANGRPVAMPGNTLKIGPNGQITAVETPDPSTVLSNKAAMMNAASSQAAARGWYWLGTGKNRRRVATEGNVLNFDKNGKFLGVKRDPSQYATGSAGTSATSLATINRKINTQIDDWVYGRPPDTEKDSLGRSYTPGWDPKTQTVTDQLAYAGAGGTQALSYWEVVDRIITEGGGSISEEQARQRVNRIFQKNGTNPNYAALYDLALGERVPAGVTAGVSGYGGR